MLPGVTEDRERGCVIGDWKQCQRSAGCPHRRVIATCGETAILAKNPAVLIGKVAETNK